MNIADINTLARFLTGTDSNDYTAANLLIAVNASYERITGKLHAETLAGDWKYGDANYAAFPNYTIDLTNSEPQYSLRIGTLAYDAEGTAFTVGLVLTGGTSGATGMIEVAVDDGSTGTLTLTDVDGTFQDNETITDSGSGSATSNGLFIDSTPLVILGVEILDNSGNYHVIRPITFQEIRRKGIAQSEYFETDGRPVQYEKRENRIVLYPAPDNGVTVTLANGLRVFYLRTADVFTSAQVTTAAKVPGFPSPWHDILAYEAAYLFAIAKGLANANFLKAELDRKEKEMFEFIGRRNQDNRPLMTMAGGRGHGHGGHFGGHSFT